MSESDNDPEHYELFTSSHQPHVGEDYLEHDEDMISISMQEFQNIIRLKAQFDKVSQDAQDSWTEVQELKKVYRATEKQLQESLESVGKLESANASLTSYNKKVVEQHKILTHGLDSKHKGTNESNVCSRS